jgi:hypothetical protein
MDQAGLKFFDTGAAVVKTLGRLAEELPGDNMSGAKEHFSGNFQGSSLGLLNPVQYEEKDDIRRYRFESGGHALDRAGALKEWHDYLATFESVESAELHLDRLLEWEDPSRIRATTRLELIGTPRGAPGAAVDRATFDMEFESLDGRPVITKTAMIQGERILGEAPQFRDVSSQAGIDFTNQYYPAFLDQPLRFGMIRYGPAGITASDYNGDGFYDLFIYLPIMTTTATRTSLSAVPSNPTSCFAATATAPSRT